MILAHGIGDASALPIPLGLVLLAAGAVVAGWTAAALPRARARAGHGATPDGVPLPRLGAMVEARATRVLLRGVGVLGLVGLVVLGVAGPAGAEGNALPRSLLVVVWGGLVPVSLVAPGAWRAVDPLRGFSRLLGRVTGDPDEETVRALPPRLGRWPAAGLVTVVVAAVAVRPGPVEVLVVLAAVGLVLVGGAVVAGRTWYTAADPLEAVADIVGRLSPIGRGEAGGLVLGGVGRRLAAPVAPGTAAVAAVLIGSSLADFARDTATGRAVVGGSTPRVLLSVALGIAVAAAFVRAVAGVRVLVPALLPVAVGYQLAHLFAPLLVEGQVAAGQIATAVVEGPAAQAQLVADYTILPGTLAALLQLAGFLLPHLIAGHVAATLAVDRYRSANAGRALVGFRVLLVLSAVGGTALRYGAA